MSVVICDSVVHLSISGPHECDSQHPSSSWRSTAHGRTPLESDRPNPLHIISTQLITLLMTFLSNDSFVTHAVDFCTAVTHCHDGPGLHHFTGTTQVSMVLVSTTSSIPDKSHSLSRWPWSSPLHRNSRSLGSQPPGFHHRVDVDVSRSGFDVSVFVSIGCCTRHSTPATKLILSRFISFHILSLVNHFVPMSATFDSVETCFVTNYFSSMACCNHSLFTST